MEWTEAMKKNPLIKMKKRCTYLPFYFAYVSREEAIGRVGWGKRAEEV
jgi:hypothetical protein